MNASVDVHSDDICHQWAKKMIRDHNFKILLCIEWRNWPENGSIIYSLRVLFILNNQITPLKETWSCLIFCLIYHTMLIHEFYNCPCICSIGNNITDDFCLNIIYFESLCKTDSTLVTLFFLRKLFRRSFWELQNRVMYLMMSETYYHLFSITYLLMLESLADQTLSSFSRD
jgi:hypothetical protein